jgi:hypothetical protein
MLNSTLKPVSAFTGGLVPGICPNPNQPNPADLAKPADSAEGAAARIKQSEADAKARRAAVRYLGTVDCKRFPEAELALINALLADSNECVRMEAALALGNGCCCTKDTVKALMQSVSGEAENDPPEKSERVRCAAAVALERCLARCAECVQEETRRPEVPFPPESPFPGAQNAGPGPRNALPSPQIAPPAANPQAANPQAPTDSLLEQARRVLADHRARRSPMSADQSPAISVASVPLLPRTKYDAWAGRLVEPRTEPPSPLDDAPLPPVRFPTEPTTEDLPTGDRSPSESEVPWPMLR